MSPRHSVPARVRRVVPLIVLAELFGTSLWFSTNAVADALQRHWGISLLEVGHLTSAVQLGFIAGTLLFALSGIADRVSASRLFALCALVGAISNAVFALSGGALAWGLALRFITGVSLAGIYPIGMKLVVSWAPQQVGRALGWLAGMLVVGTGLPHLIRGVQGASDWRLVLLSASGLALAAGVAIWLLGDGPHQGATDRIKMGEALGAFRNRRFRAAALSYFGHMWELYAFWALAPLLVASALGTSEGVQYLVTFGVFVAGGIGCMAGGLLSARWGSARVAAIALAGSALACALYPLIQGAAPVWVVALLMWWGLSAVADSPQLSAIAATACPPERIGSGLALMNSIGFALTVPAIALVTMAWDSIDVHVAWLLLPGPLLGLLAAAGLRERGPRPPPGDIR